MTAINYKAPGSTLTATEWNVLANKLSSGLDSINTGSVVAQSAVLTGQLSAATGSFTGSIVTNSLTFVTGSFTGSLTTNRINSSNGSIVGSLVGTSLAFANGSLTGSLQSVTGHFTGAVNEANSYALGSYVVSGTANNVKVMSPAGTGSPSTWGRFVQAGSGNVGAGSQVWVTFGTGFTITPIISLGKRALADDFWVIVGSTNTGSTFVQGKTASTVFDWTATG